MVNGESIPPIWSLVKLTKFSDCKSPSAKPLRPNSGWCLPQKKP